MTVQKWIQHQNFYNQRSTRRGFGLAAMAYASSFCAGCAVNPATGEQQLIVISAAEEQRMGALEHPKILENFGGVYDDPKFSGYIATIGGRLSAVTGTSHIAFTFTVLNSPIVNAMALPGGYVYVTRGLLALAQNEAEVAGVIGHEMGHVVARHTATRISRATMTKFGLMGLSVLSGIVGIPSGTGRIASSLASLHLQSFSRGQEFEADTLGIQYMIRAGYDPDRMVTFLAQLRAHSSLRAQIDGRSKDSVDGLDIMATHPRTIDRIKRARLMAGPIKVHSRRIGRVEYQRSIDGLMFGEDPDHGVIDGQKYSHRKLRCRFEVPEGFSLFNRPNVVFARNEALGSTIIFDLDKRHSGGKLTTYLSRDWARTRLVNVETLTINRMPAATGELIANTKQGKKVVRFVAIRGAAKLIFRFLFVCPSSVMQSISLSLRQTTYSFSMLSPKEIAEIVPKRLIVHRFQGESLSSLMQRMNLNTHREQWFKLLNGGELEPQLSKDSTIRLVI